MSRSSKKERLLAEQKNRCWYCGFNVYSGEWEVEHQIPVSRGGDSSSENLVLSCRECNRRKKSRTVEEYAQAISDQLDGLLYQASVLVIPFISRDAVAQSIHERIEAIRELALEEFNPRFHGESNAPIHAGVDLVSELPA